MDECLKERYELAAGRIREIQGEELVPSPYRDFFQKEAVFLTKAVMAYEEDRTLLSLEELQEENHSFYEDILPENYGSSYGNPAFASEQAGEYGQVFTFLYKELSGAVCFACEKRLWDLTVLLELFLEIYSSFCTEELPGSDAVKASVCSYIEDYCQEMTEQRVREMLDPSLGFFTDILMNADLEDPRYLYLYGEYITANELETAAFLNSLDQEEIDKMAQTFTEGYRLGFVHAKKDLRKKKTVDIRFRAGFERMVRCAVPKFREMGLEPVVFRRALHAVSVRNQNRNGFTGAAANLQYDYDHRQDRALFLTHDFENRQLRAYQTSYEKYKSLASVYAGPALIETFGESPFTPDSTEGTILFSEKQQKLNRNLENGKMQIVNRYIKGEERSFTIISYPLPEIGNHYPEIFRETVRINTLDSAEYEKIQQKIIDALDQSEWVEVKGREDNETDLLIHLHLLEKPDKQTNFENCTADVNIPVGEVFTSPVLAGTGGILHVKKVYLEGLLFRDLRLVFDCGQVIDYSCANFETEEENRKYIEDNILYHHPRIAMGEFAIGTNTTAYTAARKYGIEGLLPILIAEKTGPHFAVGDTCYSHEEDVPVFNSDGKEIIARDNEISEMRKDDLSLAYFGCHTDITIPYDELGSIRTILDDGEMVSIIENGRFVLPGTEKLNAPLDEAKEELQL